MAQAAEGGTDWRLAAICVTLLMGIFGALAFLATRMSGREEEKPEPRAAGAQKRRGALDRMQRGAARAAASGGRGEDEGEEGEGQDAGDRDDRRSAQKQQRKQEKREQQQADRQARQQQDSAKSEKQSKYDQRQREKEAERQRKEEEEKRDREEKEKREQEDFNKWKQMFDVEAEGEDDSAGQDEGAIERFVEYVKTRKVVNLEDLSAEFRMRTTDAIDRLQQLEKMGRVSGIFDDRGKFVYITEQEMDNVAEWLRSRGRISRADLVAACNRIIRLNPTEDDMERIKADAQSAAVALDEEPEA